MPGGLHPSAKARRSRSAGHAKCRRSPKPRSSARGARVRLDFDRFLDEPNTHLAAAFRHLAIDASERDVQAILDGPEMRRYSKAPEHAYDTALRRAVLNEARMTHGAEIGAASPGSTRRRRNSSRARRVGVGNLGTLALSIGLSFAPMPSHNKTPPELPPAAQ
jgi:hypothetical protein